MDLEKNDYVQKSLETLNQAKSSIDGLSVRQLLRKDYKQIDTIGLAALTLPLETFVEKWTEEKFNIADYAKESGIDVLILCGLVRGRE